MGQHPGTDAHEGRASYHLALMDRCCARIAEELQRRRQLTYVQIYARCEDGEQGIYMQSSAG